MWFPHHLGPVLIVVFEVHMAPVDYKSRVVQDISDSKLYSGVELRP